MSRRVEKSPYECHIHGPYREYTDVLSHLKNWCLLWVTLGIIPLTILLYTLKVSYCSDSHTAALHRCL
ncbi:hypothetical protein DPMN_096452 [Dreissena polymorpha]|uniref:Uncharacterized protein n=1 Tax=Dreissena polymorpha TaxID=45954 RepID=A0A9D4L9S2_DREPO|nr:hypothetical protein DPMN_096452 [Dreissena polymorpha]